MKRLYLFDEEDKILLMPACEKKEISLKWQIPRSSCVPMDNIELHEFVPDELVGRLPDGKTKELGMRNEELSFNLQSFPLRETSRLLSAEDYQRAGKAWELLYWSEQTRYCGRCGSSMAWHTVISRRCTGCGQEIWPQLNTAIIVLVHRGDEALLVKAKTFRRNFFGLVAGFVETGESLEECVAREVREETSLVITNIRYFGSQPWPYPLGLMIGFHADYVSGEVTFADGELKDGRFFRKDNIPTYDDGTFAIPGPESMARRLIDDWLKTTY